MKRAFALLLIVGALSAGSLIAQAHGPGGTADIPNVHCHAAGATFEVYVVAPVAGPVGVGILGLPVPTGAYIIGPSSVPDPANVIRPAATTNANGCADSIIP